MNADQFAVEADDLDALLIEQQLHSLGERQIPGCEELPSTKKGAVPDAIS